MTVSKPVRGHIMKQRRQLRIRKRFYIVLASVVSAGCGPVYPAGECKSPPPPKTVPESPRSQCKEVSTEHAKDWPQKYKDIQYNEENAVYWMRAAFIELTDATQQKLKSEFASALTEVNSADGKYLQLIDAAVAGGTSDNPEATKALSETIGKFVTFFDEHLKGTPAGTITSGAQKRIDKAKAFYQELKSKAEPPPAPAADSDEPSPAPAADSAEENEDKEEKAEKQ